jgi:hypothetical protein
VWGFLISVSHSAESIVGVFQATSMPPPPPRLPPAQTADASEMADAFLSSLGMEPESSGLPTLAPKQADPLGHALPPPPGLDADEDAALGFAEKPINLFKAIFEDSDSEEEEEERDGGDAVPPSAEGGEGGATSHVPGGNPSHDLAPGADVAAMSADAHEPGTRGGPVFGGWNSSAEGGERAGGSCALPPASETVAQQARRRAEGIAGHTLPKEAPGRGVTSREEDPGRGQMWPKQALGSDGGVEALRERALAAAGRKTNGGYAAADYEGVAGNGRVPTQGAGTGRRDSESGEGVSAPAKL